MNDFYEIEPTIKAPDFGLDGLQNNMPELLDSFSALQTEIDKHHRKVRRLLVASIILSSLSLTIQIIRLWL